MGRGVAVLDLYEWLPGYGENCVDIRTKGAELSVVIAYDGEKGELKKELAFTHAAAFYKTAFPGPNILSAGSMGFFK